MQRSLPGVVLGYHTCTAAREVCEQPSPAMPDARALANIPFPPGRSLRNQSYAAVTVDTVVIL